MKRFLSLILSLLLLLPLAACGEEASEPETEPEEVALSDGTLCEALPVLEISALPYFRVCSQLCSMRRNGANMVVQVYGLGDVAGETLTVNSQTDFSIELAGAGLNYYNIIVMPGESLAQNQLSRCAESGEVFWDENLFELIEETPEYALIYGEKTYGGSRAWYLAEIDGTLVAIERWGFYYRFDKDDPEAREAVLSICGEIVREHIRIYDRLSEADIKAMLPSRLAIQGSELSVPAEEIVGWYDSEIEWIAADSEGARLRLTLINTKVKDEESGKNAHAPLMNKYAKGEADPDPALSSLLGTPVVPDGEGGYIVKIGKNQVCALSVGPAG